MLSGMAVGREGAELVVAGDKMYCIGGYDGVNLLDSAEKYDTVTEEWSPIACMSVKRSGRFLLKNKKMMYTPINPLKHISGYSNEAVLTSTHNLFLQYKEETYYYFSCENCHFYSHKNCIAC